MKYLLSLILLFSLFYSCDIVEPTDNYYVIDTVSNIIPDSVDKVVKKVMLFDFTGIRCVNCPRAHETMHQLQSVYPDRLVEISVHGTSLAIPIGEYVTDLRTDDGTEMISTFGISAIPTGLVDYYDKNYLSSETAWADEVSNAIEDVPAVGISIQNSYNSSSNNLNISIEIISLTDFQNGLKLDVFVVEDSVITRQAIEESPGYEEEYVQMNVFRDAISNVWGDDIFVVGASVNDKDTKDYSYSFSADWNSENSRIIAFVFDENNKILNLQVEPVQ